jgi:hypothetical protein
LEAVDEWPPAFVRCLGAWREEIERPRQAEVRKLEDPFK